MEETYCPKRISRRRVELHTLSNYFKVELFNLVIDSQLQELNDRFDNVNTSLIECLSCLDPCEKFASFNTHKLVEFAKFYPLEFADELARKMIEKKKDIAYPNVYLLVKLTLILSVATASVERVFSSMNFVKDNLRNRMSDDWLNSCLMAYIEHDVFDKVEDETIMQYFQEMKPRRMTLY
ncbi:hypothetical protein Cni_G06322 [Canna indica]|uniref:HAT C-terminal dimerisation domain-containing protein n=1 Tax=Canna indica TaxID=4628 RepID=A0AAQ3Q6E4_9LILI|nr:hypothetical protein Cni_G06322 [Canna indica]